MRTTVRLVVVAGALLLGPGVALAQQDPIKHMMVEAGPTVVFPQADADDTADTSLGFRASFTYWANGWVGPAFAFQYVFVNIESAFDDQVSAYFYAIEVGLRVTQPGEKKIKAFGELMLGRHTVHTENDVLSNTDSDVGFRLGGGALFQLGAGLAGIAEMSYASANVNQADVDHFDLEFGLAYIF